MIVHCKRRVYLPSLGPARSVELPGVHAMTHSCVLSLRRVSHAFSAEDNMPSHPPTFLSLSLSLSLSLALSLPSKPSARFSPSPCWGRLSSRHRRAPYIFAVQLVPVFTIAFSFDPGVPNGALAKEGGRKEQSDFSFLGLGSGRK